MDLLGDISLGDGSFDTGVPNVDMVPAGSYDVGALGRYSDLSQGMAPYAPDYGVVYDNPGALQAALSGTVNSTPYQAATAPGVGSGGTGYRTSGLNFANQGSPAAGNDPAKANEILNRNYADKQSPVARALGMPSTSDGTATDWANPKTIAALTKALGVGGGLLSQVMNRGRQANAQSGQQLLSQLQSNARNNWNPSQQMMADKFFSQQYVPTSQRPQQAQPVNVVQNYAEGGNVLPGEQDAPDDMDQQSGPLSGLVSTDGSGQADDVPVNLSGGEYVVPADVVSTLGDGNNAAGAKILDQWVQQIRQRARSTGPEDNPPPAHAPDGYLSGSGGGDDDSGGALSGVGNDDQGDQQ